jgi:hypothetical protein
MARNRASTSAASQAQCRTRGGERLASGLIRDGTSAGRMRAGEHLVRVFVHAGTQRTDLPRDRPSPGDGERFAHHCGDAE